MKPCYLPFLFIILFSSCKKKGTGVWSNEDIGGHYVALLDSHVAINRGYILRYYTILSKDNNRYTLESMLCNDTSVISIDVTNEEMRLKRLKGNIEIDSINIFRELDYDEADNKQLKFGWTDRKIDPEKLVGIWTFYDGNEILIIDSIKQTKAVLSQRGGSLIGAEQYKFVVKGNNIFFARTCNGFMHYQVIELNDTVMKAYNLGYLDWETPIATFRRLKSKRIPDFDDWSYKLEVEGFK